MKLKLTRAETQMILLNRLQITQKELSAQTGVGVNILTRYFNGAIRKEMALKFYGDQIDLFLQSGRVNPEFDGGGE
jgi:hypothetical protein